MSGPDIFLAAVYVVYIASPLLPDELWLRLALVSSSVGFVIWGALIGNGVTVLANGLFALLSISSVLRLLKARRPVDLTDEQQVVFDSVFPSMTPQQFKQFWELGESFELQAEQQLITVDEPVDHVSVLINGALGVKLGADIKRLDPPALVGEMSYMSDRGATASNDVLALEPCHGRRWAKTILHELHDTHPELTGPLLRSIGRDLAAKVRTN